MNVEPVDLLKRAVAALEEASVPEDLRTLAFAKVVDLLACAPSATPAHVRSVDVEATGNHGGQDQLDEISRIASKIGISTTLLDRIFDQHEGALIFSGNVSSLGKTKSDKVHSLALLLLAGRRWAGLDGNGATPDEVLRAEVDRLGLLDVSNYSKHIATLKPYVTITGSGKNGVYKIKYDGLEKAAKIGRDLAGVE
jgi:hypothetical protein